MDEIVVRGMLKWPNVPAVYGWLSLDRRGNWKVKGVSGRFESIANPAVREFIGRNYAADEKGRWYFQNGPQRVYVSLDYTPWVYRIDDAGEGLLAHTGAVVRAPEAAFLDDAGSMLLETEIGVGVLLDRDLSSVIGRFAVPGGGPVERLLEEVVRGAEARVLLRGRSIRIASLRGVDVPRLFEFVQRPQPPAGEPECS